MSFCGRRVKVVFLLGAGLVFAWTSGVRGQERSPGSEGATSAQLELRKTAKTRLYQGKSVEGEERAIQSGETLWGILIQEKGLSERRFNRYLGLIRELNPQVKELDTLQVGERLFIPFRLDEMLGMEVFAQGEVRIYRVKAGDRLYKILRSEFGIEGREETETAFKKVQELNPSKRNWNLLIIGEALRFPAQFGAQPSLTKKDEEKSLPVNPAVDAVRGLAENRWQLLEKVAEALGVAPARTGEEVFHLQEGKITLDRAIFPVFSDPRLGRKVVIDSQGAMPPSLKARIEEQSPDTAVLAVKKGSTLGEIGSQLLAQLGYQSLPADRPLVVHDTAVNIQLKGDWMIMPPETTEERGQIWVFLLADGPERIPRPLTDYLATKGVKLTQILPLASSSSSALPQAPRENDVAPGNAAEELPADKTALVDSLLRHCQISFARDQELSVPVRAGIHLEMRVDRYLETGGKKVGFLFSGVPNDVKATLDRATGLKLVEIDLKGLPAREIVARVLSGLGESSIYAEQRFEGAQKGRLKDSLVVSLHGFFLRSRSLLLTDRPIPPDVGRFLVDQGIKIAYFR